MGVNQKYIGSDNSVAPKDVICDAACGTAGFLIAASEHLIKHNSDAIYKDAGAQTAFSEFLNDRSLNPQQIQFVEMVIEQLTERWIVAVYTAVI